MTRVDAREKPDTIGCTTDQRGGGGPGGAGEPDITPWVLRLVTLAGLSVLLWSLVAGIPGARPYGLGMLASVVIGHACLNLPPESRLMLEVWLERRGITATFILVASMLLAILLQLPAIRLWMASLSLFTGS